MSKVLVVSDNEILNQLYVTNLEVYLGVTAFVIHSANLAKKLLTEDSNWDLILTMNMINGVDAAEIIHQFILQKKISIPLIIIGNIRNDIPNSLVVQSSYNLKNILKKTAEILKITPQIMIELELPDYYKISIASLMHLKISPCSIYLQVKNKNKNENGHFVMVVKKNTKSEEVFKKFKSEGILHLYVEKNDRLIVVNEISNCLCLFLKKVENLDLVCKVSAFERGFEFVAGSFFQSTESAENVMKVAFSCMKVMEDISFERTPLSSLIHLFKANKKGHLFSHSILASFVASHISKKMPWGIDEHREKMNFVLFFHDVALAPLYVKFPDFRFECESLTGFDFTDKDRDLILNHARIASELVLSFKGVPHGADVLIRQHHGMLNGVGFAKIFKEEISPLSKVVLIAEDFIEEAIRRKGSDLDFKVEVKSIIAYLSDKYKKKSYLKIIETLETIKI